VAFWTQAAEAATEASQLAAKMAEATALRAAATDLGAVDSRSATGGATPAAAVVAAAAPAPALAAADRGQRTVGMEDGLGLAQADLASAPTMNGVHATETAPVSARGRFSADSPPDNA
jgi:hypothetical protein